jgi:hypothetical protein
VITLEELNDLYLGMIRSMEETYKHFTGVVRLDGVTYHLVDGKVVETEQ